MPKDIPAEEAPIPRDPRVNVNDVPTELLAVREFPGGKNVFSCGLKGVSLTQVLGFLVLEDRANSNRTLKNTYFKVSLEHNRQKPLHHSREIHAEGFGSVFGLGVCTSFVSAWTVLSCCFVAPVAAVDAHTAVSHTSLCRIILCPCHVRASENCVAKGSPPMAKYQGNWTPCCGPSKQRRHGVRKIQPESRTV